MFFKIRLPQALPHIFTGLKVGAALAATAAVVAEFVASDKGLGYLLLQYNGNLDTPMVFATIVLLSLIGLVVYYVVEIIERLAIPWHVSQQQTADEMRHLNRFIAAAQAVTPRTTMEENHEVVRLSLLLRRWSRWRSSAAALRAGRGVACASTGIWAACTCRSTTARTRASTRPRASTSRSTKAAARPTPCRWSPPAPTRSASPIRRA